MGTPLEPSHTPERLPGEFARHPHTGAPYVTHPTKTVTPRGNKTELAAKCRAASVDPTGLTVAQMRDALPAEPALVIYSRPSSYGQQIENQGSLHRWLERHIVTGLGLQPGLLREASTMLATVNPDTPEWGLTADRIVAAAKQASGTHLAAERGTFVHKLLEHYDRGRPWAHLAQEGTKLGVTVETQQNIIDTWAAMLATYQLRMVKVETTCVDDIWRCAGTLDRIAVCETGLRFTTDEGEIVRIPAGTTIIVDIKTGRLPVNPQTGTINGWRNYTVQLASYAQSRPYDTDTGVRGEWVDQVGASLSQDWAIIAHVDAAAAMAGNTSCQLVLADIAAGRRAGALCAQAREWERTTGLFTLPGAVTVADPPDVDEIVAAVAAGVVTEAQVRADLGAPPVLVDDFDTPRGTTTTKHARLWPAEQKQLLPTNPDEGELLDEGTFAPVIARYEQANEPTRKTIALLLKQAANDRVDFHGTHRTVRTWWIIRGLLTFLEADADDLTLRTVAAQLHDLHLDQIPDITTGHLIGALNQHTAEMFARYGDAYDAGMLVANISDGNNITLDIDHGRAEVVYDRETHKQQQKEEH